MPAEENKAIIYRYFDQVVGQGRIEVLAEVMSEDVLGHDPTSPEPVRGFEGLKAVIQHFHTAFPQAQYPVYSMLAEGDQVAVRWGIQGVHRGPFLGISPAGKPVDVYGIIIYRLENQKIVEYWGCFDVRGILQQLGDDAPR